MLILPAGCSEMGATLAVAVGWEETVGTEASHRAAIRSLLSRREGGCRVEDRREEDYPSEGPGGVPDPVPPRS
jgi:hypothetical protein